MFDLERVTAELHRELGAVREERPGVRHAGLVTQLRLAGEVGVHDGRTTILAEFDAPAPALRMRSELGALHGRGGMRAEVVTAGGTTLRYQLRVTAPGADLARATGLVDRIGRPVHGLPPAVVAAGPAVAAGVWRGALIARGRIVRPAGRIRLVVSCSGPAVVLALVGAARGLGVLAAPQETVTGHRVVVRDPDSAESLLRSVGAPGVAEALGRVPAVPREPSAADGSLQTVNAHRAATAAAATAERVRLALQVLGADVAPHLRETALLRLEHPSLSLAELGRLADPPLTKDTVAGRLRRLVRLSGVAGPDED
ncbi:DNA-binding protein WhiA [Pseudonocardia sp. ICBG1293]|uniref:DNA-binding protein WhiA n=1 Tax=Pseudonocardia sp. ICBG1293 TaxID=2844382 RepID=UPI001CCE5D3D|nr:DNA-binding protein WhiA [Pseudonocardia sp. ICBG1293]